MGLADLIRTLKKNEGLTLVPLVDKMLLGRNRIIDSVEEWVHPSSVPAVEEICPRSMFFDLYTPIEKYPKELLVSDHTPRVHRIFDNGTLFHRRWQSYLIELGICDPVVRRGWEIPVLAPDYGVKGHADAVIWPEAQNKVEILRGGLANGEIPITNALGGYEYRCYDLESKQWIECRADDHAIRTNVERPWWQPKGKPILVEFKSINEYGWNHLGNKPKPEHSVQATIYASILQEQNPVLYKDLSEILFLYENKNTQEPKEFRVPVDTDLWAKLSTILTDIQRSRTRGTLPNRVCKSAITARAQECCWNGPCFVLKTYAELIGADDDAKKKNNRKKNSKTRK